MSPHARSSADCSTCAAAGAARRNSMPARSEIAAIDALVSSTAAAWSNGNPVRLRVSSRNDCCCSLLSDIFKKHFTQRRKGYATAQRRAFPFFFAFLRSLRLCVKQNLNNGRHDLADAALEFAVVGNGRAHRHVGSIDWRNAECDELCGVNQ